MYPVLRSGACGRLEIFFIKMKQFHDSEYMLHWSGDLQFPDSRAGNSYNVGCCVTLHFPFSFPQAKAKGYARGKKIPGRSSSPCFLQARATLITEDTQTSY